MSLSLALISLFPCVIPKEYNYILPHGMDIPSNLIVDLTWQGWAITFVCVVVPNVFLFYFGQDIPQGCMSMDSTKAAFGRLGPGYATWISLANELLEEDENMYKVFHNGITKEGAGGSFDTFVS